MDRYPAEAVRNIFIVHRTHPHRKDGRPTATQREMPTVLPVFSG